MARPIPDTKDLDLRTKLGDIEELKPKESKSIFDISDHVSTNGSKNFIIGIPVKPTTPMASVEHELPLPPEPIPPKPPESFPPDDVHIFETPTFLPPKPIPQSPKISPSSIPNPNPSVTTTKHVESGYPNYGGFLYSIPGYSAFQPVNHSGMPVYHPGLIQQNQPLQIEPVSSDFVPYSPSNSIQPAKEPVVENVKMDTNDGLMVTDGEEVKQPPVQTSLENSKSELKTVNSNVLASQTSTPAESTMSITSLAQGSGATVTISPSLLQNKEVKKKTERFSLKTSIPISKIDMKCVNNPPDGLFSNSLTKKPFNSTFSKDVSRVEIQSNIVIKSAVNERENKDSQSGPPTSTNLNTLINAVEAVSETDNHFRIPEPPKSDLPVEVKKTPPIFNPMNLETSKINFTKVSDRETFSSDTKNQIVFVQNKNSNMQSPKMVLAIQPQSPQVLLQRSNLDSKNAQAPSRLPHLNKKCKEGMMNEGTASKVVSLKRLHQENCDENDFENLITENQIYGNKIVVKEKSQGTQQEQDLKNKKIMAEKMTTNDAKNVVLQPNFLYLSNVQFPNMMIVKNNTKITDNNKLKLALTEHRVVNESNTINPTTEINVINNGNKNMKQMQPTIHKEIQLLKASNNSLQSSAIKVNSDQLIHNPEIIMKKPDNNVMKTKSDTSLNKPDILIQTNQKVIMNSQIVYQVPLLVEGDKINQPTIMNINSKDYPKFAIPNKELTKQFTSTKINDKLYITCPYQMDSKLQPKIVITNLRQKMEEVSSLDVYEKRRRLRRLKYLTNRDNYVNKDVKIEGNSVSLGATAVKKIDKADVRNIITPERMQKEIYKEFVSYKGRFDDENTDSDSDEYDDEDLRHYESIIEKYSANDKSIEEDRRKSEFLVNFRLASQETYKEQDLDIQERMLKFDKVRSAYAAVGRLDLILNHSEGEQLSIQTSNIAPINPGIVKERNLTSTRKKTMFLSRLKLTQVTQKFKEGYEKAWEVILQERQRRNNNNKNANSITWPSLHLDTKGQLQLMSEIQQCVTENNNLIKRMFDTIREKQSNEDSISVLAEKNFSELNRLSKMADQSVKLVSGQSMRKRDLNPGFDSENIQKERLEQNCNDYPKLNIPNISKIISLKSTHEYQNISTTPATSMDEPRSSAAGVNEMFCEATNLPETSVNVSCQVEDCFWPGVEYLTKSYKEYDGSRRREINELHRRTTALRVAGAHITRAASRESDRARALLAERQNLAIEENNLRLSIQRLRAAIDDIRNYTG